MISVNWPDALLPAVRIDSQAMTQVFVNLLDNAMKYSGRSRQIGVDLLTRGDCIAVSVTDFGIGIAPNDQERIFQQFYRASTAVDNGVNGSGLGLAIVRHVVEAHGGSIKVESGLGRGTSFTVRIPIPVDAAARATADVSCAAEGVGFRAGARA